MTLKIDTDCQACGVVGRSFEDYTAFELSDVHMDDVDPATKSARKGLTSPSGYAKYEVNKATTEFAKCESLCARCHDLEEKSAGVTRPKRTK